MRFDVPEEITGIVPFVHRRLFGAAKGLITGGPLAAAAGFLAGGRSGRAMPATGLLPAPPTGLAILGPGKRQGTAIVRQQGTALVAAGAAPHGHGFHLNKSSYFLIDGTFVAEGTRWVKNRRRNPLNARALGRAISRVNAGKVWQSKLAEISTGKFTAAGNRK